MKGLEQVTDATFKDKVLNATRPVLVDFTAAWCAPCKSMLPGLIDLANEYEGEVDILALNIDENPQLVEKYNIRGVPTFLMFKQGKVVSDQSGSMSRLQLSKLFDQVLEA